MLHEEEGGPDYIEACVAGAAGGVATAAVAWTLANFGALLSAGIAALPSWAIALTATIIAAIAGCVGNVVIQFVQEVF